MKRVLMVSLAALLTIGGVAFASIPGADGVIHGCFAKSTGRLRVINTDRGMDCARGERRLSWNQAGVPGQDGAPGLQGEPGPGGIADRLSPSVPQLVGDNQQATASASWTQSAGSINVAWARATVMWDTAYDGCGGNPDIRVTIKQSGNTVGVFPAMTTRTATTILDPVRVDHIFWSDASVGRNVTINVSSLCGKVDVDVEVWIEEVV